MRSLSLHNLKGATMMALVSQWYATMIYWLPFLEITGSRPVSSVYSLLVWVVLMWIVLFPSSGNPSGVICSVGMLCFLVGLVDRTCCLVCTICHFMVYLLVGEYLVAFWYVSPGQESNLPDLVALSQVSLTGNPAAAWKYWIRASTIGIS